MTTREAKENKIAQLLQLIDEKNELEREIYDIKQAYIYEPDDEKAEKMRREWHEIAKERRALETRIDEFFASCK